MSSNLQQFNTTLKEFLTNLINIFPKTQGEILKHYRPLLEGGEYEPLIYCNDFMNRAKEHQKDIANKNETIFHHSICLFPGIDFEVFWNSEFNTPKTKKSIWIYLNVFWSLGSRVLEEERVKAQKLKGLSDEDKILMNLKEAYQNDNQEKLSSKEQFLRNLTDKELMNEINRRKEERTGQKVEQDDEEDLLNFDPEQGYSLWNAIKGMTGGAGGNNMMSGLSGILGNLGDTFGIDLSNFNIGDIDMNNIGKIIQDALTPENMNKLKNTVTKFATDFQEDIDSGNIDKSELTNVFNMVTENVKKMASGEMNSEDGQQEMMEQLMKSSQKMFGNMIPPQMRGQFEKLQREMMSDPSKMAKMMSNPQAMIQEMMGGNKGAQNRFKEMNRANDVRARLAKKLQNNQRLRKEQEQGNETTSQQSDSTSSNNSSKKQNNNKNKKTEESSSTLNTENSDIYDDLE
jgi:hypothetical protein